MNKMFTKILLGGAMMLSLTGCRSKATYGEFKDAYIEMRTYSYNKTPNKITIKGTYQSEKIDCWFNDDNPYQNLDYDNYQAVRYYYNCANKVTDFVYTSYSGVYYYLGDGFKITSKDLTLELNCFTDLTKIVSENTELKISYDY